MSWSSDSLFRYLFQSTPPPQGRRWVGPPMFSAEYYANLQRERADDVIRTELWDQRQRIKKSCQAALGESVYETIKYTLADESYRRWQGTFLGHKKDLRTAEDRMAHEMDKAIGAVFMDSLVFRGDGRPIPGGSTTSLTYRELRDNVMEFRRRYVSATTNTEQRRLQGAFRQGLDTVLQNERSTNMMDDNDVLDALVSVGPRMVNALTVAKEVLSGKDGEADKEHVTVSLVKQPVVPVRHESKARDHRFFDLVSFVAYVETYAHESSVVFVDAEWGRMHFVINDVASHGREQVEFSPLEHPLLKPWHEALDKNTTPTDLAGLMLANRQTLVLPMTPSGKQDVSLLMMMRQIRSSNTIVREEGIGNNSVNGVMCTTQIGSKIGASELVELPESFWIRTPIFYGTENIDIEIDMLVDLDRDGKVKIVLSSADLKVKALDQFTRWADEVRIKLEQNVLVCCGRPSEKEWQYI